MWRGCRWVTLSAIGVLLALPLGLSAADPDAKPIAECRFIDSAAQQARTFYRFKFSETSASGTLVRLDLVDGTQTGTAPPNPIETSVLTTEYQTVAMGTAADGTIYALEGCGSTPRAGCFNTNLIRYNAAGATALGQVTGLPPLFAGSPNMGANANAADIDLSTGNLIVGVLRTGGSMSTLYRIDVNTRVATLIKLNPAIPGNTNGDFSIDPTGQFAYGVSLNSTNGTSYAWRADLATGAVTTLSSLPSPFPVGGSAWLANDLLAFISNVNQPPSPLFPAPTAGITYIGDQSGTMLANDRVNGTTTLSNSTDASSCIPKTRVYLNVVDSANHLVPIAPGATYSFQVTCTGGAPGFAPITTQTSAIANVSGGKGYVDLPIPVGSSGCTVTETASPAAPAGYTWGGTTYIQFPASIPLVTPSATIIKPLEAIPQPATVTFTKALAHPGPIQPNSSVVYTLTVQAGGTVIHNLTVSDPLPAGVTGGTWTCTGTCSAGGSLPLNDTIASFPAGGSATYVLTATTGQGPLPTQIVNTASLSASDPIYCTATASSGPCVATVSVNTVSSVVVKDIPTLNLIAMACLGGLLTGVACYLTRRRASPGR